MKKHLLLFALAAGITPATTFAQSIPFTNQTSLLPTTTFHSGNAVAVVDMNGDFKDDIVRASGNATMFIEYQQAPNAAFTESSFSNTFGNPWGMCVADIDNNGYNDVFYGTSSNSRILNANASGTAYSTVQVNTLTGAGSIFVQGCNFADINNDGYIDMFVCNDVAMPHIYIGNGTDSGWVFDQSIMPLATFPVSDNSGNYASIWTDINNDGLIDLMITHCRQGVTNNTDPRRIDQVFINNGNGTYTQDVTNWTNLRDGAQGWSTAWGDIDNDGDMDGFVLNYDVNSTMMINNGSGVFTDVMAASGIGNTTTFFGMNATFQDFDNDTYLDLLLTGDDHFLYKGNGDGTFALVSPNPFVYSTYTITSHAIGDLNDDGFLDVYGSYCTVYNSPSSSRNDRLWMNDCPAAGNTNHWVKFNLIGGATAGMSNRNGVGAIVKIYGPWGVQVREVRSGEAYGIQNSFTVHFGLGQNMMIDSAIVSWPSGVIDEVYSVGADNVYAVMEGGFTTSTQQIDNKPFSMAVYPNPVTDVATIRLDHFTQFGLDNLSLSIYDMTGKVVYAESGLRSSIIYIDREMLSSGLYFVEVKHNDQRLATQKMLMQ
jgi:hypothetical protein